MSINTLFGDYSIQTASVVCCLAAVLLFAGCSGASKGPVVETPLGSVQGGLADGVHVFRDLPYAAPPVGELRWQRPHPAKTWAGVRDATRSRAICEQPLGDGDLNSGFLAKLLDGAGFSGFGKFAIRTFAGLAGGPTMSEDCLTLTVRSQTLEQDAGLPVMVWIHGGGHRYGSGNDAFSDSNALAARGVVHVSINYRLGIWGFFAHSELAAEDPDGSTGNYGLLDQIESLKWVQANIAAAEGLVHGAIAQSGTGNHQMQHVHHEIESIAGVAAGTRFAELAGITEEQQLAALRKLSVDTIRALENRDQEIANTWHPQVDGYALPKTVAEIFSAGEQAHVPLMLGSNADWENTFLSSQANTLWKQKQICCPRISGWLAMPCLAATHSIRQKNTS